MSGKFIVPIQLPLLFVKPDTNPAEGYFKVYFRNGKLKKLDHLGVEEDIEMDLVESDPIFSASPAASITTTNIAQWNAAFNWGDHADVGYVTLDTVQEISASKTFLQGLTVRNTFTVAPSVLENNFVEAGNDRWFRIHHATTDWVNSHLFRAVEGFNRVDHYGAFNGTYNTGHQYNFYDSGDLSTTAGLWNISFFKGNTGITNRPLITINNGQGAGVFNTPLLKMFANGNLTLGISTDVGYKFAVNGSIRATSYVVTGGTSSQFLKADGTLDSNTYLTTGSASGAYVSLSGSYANPSWITALAWTKITGAPAFLTAETDTLSSVTARGATTATTIVYTGTAEAIRPNTDSIGVLGASNFRWATVYTRGLSAGANTLDLAGPAINLNDASGNIKLKLFGSTGNVVIQNGGTFTDGGFRLDVNGTTRIQGDITLNVISALLKTSAAGLVSAAVAGTDYVVPGTLSSYVPTTRTLTINGTTFDLSANRSWTIATSTLDAVTAAGNTTTNAITVGGVSSTADYALRADNALANVRLGRFKFIRSSYDPTGVAASIDFWRGPGANEGVLAFSTNPGTAGDNAAERMRITTGGNILIGTTTDSGYKLDVAGNTRVFGGNTSADVPFIINSRFQFRGDGVLSYGNSANHGRLTWGASGVYFHALSGYGVGIGANGTLDHLFINTAGRVGIGTTTASDLLDVQGVIRFSSSANPSVNGYARIYTSYNYAKGEVYIEPEGSTNPTRFFPNGGVVIGTTTQQPPTNGLIVSGNVGIGTISPTSRLHVSGGRIEIDNGFNLESRTTTGTALTNLIGMSTNAINVGVWEGNYMADLFLKGGNGSVFADFSQGNSKFFAVRGVASATPTEYMRVNHLGNVLIGTTTDSGFKFDVNGTGRFSGALTAASTLAVTGGVTFSSSSFRVSPNEFRGVVSIPNTLDATNNTAYINIGTFSDSFTHIVVEVEIVPWLLNTSNIGSYSKTYVIRMTSAAPGVADVYDSRVTKDIGPTGAKYQLGTAIANASVLQIPVHYIGTGTGNQLTVIVRVTGNVTGNIDKVSLSTTAPAAVIAGTQEYVGFRNRIGVNNTAPTEALHVTGRGRFETIDNGVGDFITRTAAGVLTRRTAAETLSDIGAAPSSGSANYIQNQTAAAQTASYRISGTATALSFQIGNYNSTTSFGSALDSTGSLVFSLPTTFTGGFARGLFFNTAVSAVQQASIGIHGTNTTAERLYFGFGTAPWTGTTSLVILPSGNVGIGTTSPGAKLHVFGTDELLKFGDGTSGNNAFMSFNDRGYIGFNGSAGLNFIANSTRPIVFGTGGTFSTYTEWARFATTTGNFLVGTNTDAGYKLDVNGTLRTTNVATLGGIVASKSSLADDVIRITQNTMGAAAYLYSTGNGALGWIGENASAEKRFRIYSDGTDIGGKNLYFQIYDNTGTNPVTVLSLRRDRVSITGELFHYAALSASGGISQGARFYSNHTATANNDLLVGVDIYPSFNNAGFSSVTALPMRVRGLMTELARFESYMAYAPARIGVTTQIGANYTVVESSPDRGSAFGSITETIVSFIVNDQTRMRIFQSGNVRIQNGGTFTDNGYPFSVEGNSFFNGTVEVTGTIYADSIYLAAAVNTSVVNASNIYTSAISTSSIYVANVVETNSVTANVVNTDVVNSNVTNANSVVINGGTSNQFMKADGTLDNTSYATSNLSIAYAIALG